MKRIVLLLIIAFTSSIGFSQPHKAKAEAEIKRIFSKNYTNIKFKRARTEWEGLRQYHDYYFDAEWKQPLNFKCNPNAKVTASLSVEYWASGDKRSGAVAGVWRQKGMKEPDWKQIESAFIKEYESGNFDPLDYFSSSLLNEVLEIQEVGILTLGDDGFFEPFRNGVKFFPKDEQIGEL